MKDDGKGAARPQARTVRIVDDNGNGFYYSEVVAVHDNIDRIHRIIHTKVLGINTAMKKRRSFLRRGSKDKTKEEDSLDTAGGQQEDDEPLRTTMDANETPSPDPVTANEMETKQDSQQATIDDSHRHDVLDTRFTSVNQACEEIWKCQEPKQAASWLALLHHALLRTPLNDYLPSDVFVCISGAALRFHDEEHNEFHVDVLWTVWEEAMWAAAALARVCVGAAWRRQLRNRREWMRHKKQGLDDEGGSVHVSASSSPSPIRSVPITMVSADSTNLISYSPMTSYSTTTFPLENRTKESYPLIPENLPAALLRFAAIETFLPHMDLIDDPDEQQKWLDRRKSLIEAQKELVLALCYILPEEEPDDPALVPSLLEWTILEAHEPVACMVRSWLETASVSWYIPTKDDVDNDILADKKPAAQASHGSEDIGSSKSMESMHNTSATVAGSHADDHSFPRVERNESRERQGNVLHARVSSGELDFTKSDWWTTLQVVRAAFQLISAGWRIPQNEIGEDIITYFLGIAEKGMLLQANELKSYGTETNRVAREERLAASSSAMTAVSILSSIASVGLIPISMQSLTVKVMCRLQVRAMESDVSSAMLFPGMGSLDAETHDEWKADNDTFLEQREDCVSDIVALYWVLLAHSASAAAAMCTLVKMMSLNDSVIVREQRSADRDGTFKRFSVPNVFDFRGRTQKVQCACIAIDAVSGALWGKPPDMPGIASLRIYWHSVLDTLKKIAYLVHDWIAEVDGTWDDNQNSTTGDQRKFVRGALLLLLGVVMSLKRFIHEELLIGVGLLAPDEWDVIVNLLDENIHKWLCMTDATSAFRAETGMINEIRSEVDMLLDSIREFFSQCIQFETSPFNFVVDDECRVKLYSLLLQKAVPYMLPKKGTSLALAILRCWSVTGFAIDRSDTWARTASYIITNVFSVFEDQCFGLFQGYVHSPCVRLEALKLVALEEEDEEKLLDPDQYEASRHMSPLEHSVHVREQYLALVNGSLLPPLMTMFSVQSSNIHVAVVLPLPTASFSSQKVQLNEDIYGGTAELGNEKLSIEADEYALRRFAAKLLGRLYRIGTGEKWHRSSLLKMMLSAAINTSLDDFNLFIKPRSDAAAGNTEPETFLIAGSHTSFQAIYELEKCLTLPFGSLPHAHESLPPVVDALCSVLIVYGGEPLRERNENDKSWVALKRSLAIAAILPLARLGINYEKRLILSKQRDISELVPVQIFRRLVAESHESTESTRHEYHEEYSGPEVAPFIVVSDDHRHSGAQAPSRTGRAITERTQFSFISVFSSVLATLHTNLESKRARDRTLTAKECKESQPIDILDANFRAFCYDTLGGFVRTGLDFPFSKELIAILQVQAGDLSHDEASARCRCAASVAESLVVRSKLAPETSSLEDVDCFLQHLLSFSASTESSSVLVGCRSLRGLASCIPEMSATSGELMFNTLSDRLKLSVESPRNRVVVPVPNHIDGQDVIESLLSILYDIVCVSTEEGYGVSSTTMLLQTFDTCFKLSMSSNFVPGFQVCRLLCIQLLAVLLNKLKINNQESSYIDLQRIKARFNDWVSLLSAEHEVSPSKLFQEDGLNHRMILGDLLAQKLLSSRHLRSAPQSLGQTYHELMAKETDDINRFIVEDIDKYKEAPFAAWLCGQNILLTCRLGSLKSRFRGWLEIVIRSPTSRTRRLIRLPSTNSLDCPELPSSLWYDPSNQSGDSINSTNVFTEAMKSHFTEPSSEMKKAISVINRFDEMFDQPNMRLEAAMNDKIGHDIGHRDSSKSKALYPLSSAVKEFNENADSTEEWLHLVLQDPAKVQCVVDELRTLGFAHSATATHADEFNTLNSYFLSIERLSFSPKLRRAISIMDRLPPFNTHKIALLFATEASAYESFTEQSLENMLLTSKSGSPKFLIFTKGLGKIVLTRHLKYYSGGLDTSGFDSDGKLSVVWLDRDDCFARSMVVFHVVPLMPEGANNRKRHVGNDNVHIVYVDPGCVLDLMLRRGQPNETLTSNLVSGQFGFVVIFVQTVTKEGLHKVSVRLRDGLAGDIQSRLGHLIGEHIVSEAAVPAFVRQIATRADVSCCAVMEDQLGKPNWDERQSQIAAMKRHRMKR